MLFNSLTFICFFLPITLTLYYLLPGKSKNYILTAASLFFYAWGGWSYTLLLLVMTLVDFLVGKLIERYVSWSKYFLAMGVIFNLSLLGYYKYVSFFLVNVNKYLGCHFAIPSIVLPIGISFYTFQGLSYIIDVYRYKNDKYEGNLKGCPVQKNFFNLLLYISMFPQLIAGPIVRYQEINLQIENRAYSVYNFSEGLERFIYGLTKKVIIADTLAVAVDKIFALKENQLAISIAWIGAICYTLQIYFDFSGYSDMAIGLGKLFGFKFNENFNYPYISKSITEFWRRWHISLSSWFRDYVYIPLGGNRRGNVYINLFIVFVLTGIWHGASWNFIAWGGAYGILIVAEKFLLKRIKIPKQMQFFQWLFTMLIIIVLWALFRADSFHDALSYFKAMFGMSCLQFQPFKWRYYLDNKTLFILLIAIFVALFPVQKWIAMLRKNVVGEVIVKGVNVLLFIICLLMIVNNTYSPFIYFRF